jgi:LAO/AO transport system kinase
MVGGVARKTRESMLICEAAGFDTILVETVGTGQSEGTVRSMVDFFLLVLITGAGDELQGIKRGVIELADAIAINKADGTNKARALAARAETQRALHYLSPATGGWSTQAVTCSSLSGDGIPELWELITRFHRETVASQVFAARRRQQAVEWLHALVAEQLQRYFYELPAVHNALPAIESAVTEGRMTATSGVRELLGFLPLRPAESQGSETSHSAADLRA